MTDDKTFPMVRLQDGSIDYRYYAARGSMAKNRALKTVAKRLLGHSQLTGRALPALFTVFLLALVL